MESNRIRKVLERTASGLSGVQGIQAVVLGGSRARGTHTADSDIDIGLYYDSDTLDLSALNAAVQALDDEHRGSLIVTPGQWGAWVNGGGWLIIGGMHVDLILRDVARVATVIAECQEGVVGAHYQTGHPHAYISSMYMGELAVCQMLWDKDGKVSAMKTVAEVYPAKLKKALVDFFTFEANFSLMFVKSNLAKDDVYYVAAHIVRVVSALNQVLFALNLEYCLNEKKAVKMIDGFGVHPAGYQEKVNAIFAAVGTDVPCASTLLQRLTDEVVALAAR